MYYRLQQPTPIYRAFLSSKSSSCRLAFFYRKDERAQPVKLMCCKFSLPSTLQQIWCVSLYLCHRPPPILPPPLPPLFPSPLFPPPLLPPLHLLISSSTHSPLPPAPPPLLPPLYIILSSLFLYSLSLLILL